MKIFISYRRADSSIAGEIFQYLDSSARLDAAASNAHASRDIQAYCDDSEDFSSHFSRPFDQHQIILAMTYALEIYESRKEKNRILSLMKLPFTMPKWPPAGWQSRFWKKNALAGAPINLPSPRNSNSILLLYRDFDKFEHSPHNERAPNPWPAHTFAPDMRLGGLSNGAKANAATSQALVFGGRRFEVGDPTRTFDRHSLEIDYCDLSAKGVDWSGAEFLLQMHCNSTGDDTQALLSVWRQSDDPLNSGVFFGEASPLIENRALTGGKSVLTRSQHDIWPSWLHFLFRFRIRKRRKSNKTYIYSIGKASALRALTNNRFWRASRESRPIGKQLQTLGQLFIGSGGSLEVGCELRLRAEQLVRKRLAYLPAERSLLLADANTVYALYRGSHRGRSRSNGA